MSEDFTSTQALLEYCIAAMFACSTNDVFHDQMETLYGFIMESEDKHPASASTEKLRLELLEGIQDLVKGAPTEVPEGFELADFSKCFTAVLWCRRVCEFVDSSHNQLDMMANIASVIGDISQDKFQENNT